MREAKIYVPVVILLTEDNVTVTKQLSDGLNKSVLTNAT